MKQIILTLMLALAAMTICNAQKIETKKVFGGYKYTLEGKNMTMNNLVNVMKSNPEALKLIKKARSNNVIASILGGAGGALIGFPLGAAVAGGEANWTLVGIGAGLVAVSIPISTGVNKTTKKAVELYNSSLTSTSYYQFKPEFKIVANENGIGLSMNF